MNKKHKIVIVIVISLLIISLFLFFYYNKKDRGLSGFYKLTSEDPLFYSPFNNLEEFRVSAARLKNTETELKEFVNNTMVNDFSEEEILDSELDSFILDFNQTYLFPHDFINILTDISLATEEFKKNPTYDSAENLIRLYEEAVYSYNKSVSLKINFLERYPQFIPSQLVFLRNSTSSDIILNDLKLIRENGYELKREIEKRKECLAGQRSCSNLIKESDVASFDLITKSLEFDSNNLTEKEKNNFDLIKLISSESFDYLKGPYKIDSSCWGNDTYHWMFLGFNKSENDGFFMIPSLATEKFYQILPELGNEIRAKRESFSYECTDLTFYPSILTTSYIVEKINKGESNLEDLKKNSRYRFLIENQFGLISPAMNTISRNLKTFIFWNRRMDSPNNINNVFNNIGSLIPTRSAYSIFYFPYARSIWRIDQQPRYTTGEQISIPQRAIMTIDELKNANYSEEEIINIHRESDIFWDNFHRE